MMRKHFEDKVVFITGSSKGIGKAIAFLLGSYGAKICINGRNADALDDTYRQLVSEDIRCLKLPGDVSDSEQCRAMIAKIIEEFGRLDVLVNNAGIGNYGRFKELTIDAWDRVVGINMMGPVYMSSHALPHLLKAKGSIVFISSLAGRQGMPGHSAYSLSKMGLSALAEAMQMEFKKNELHTGIMYVGFTENEENKQILSPDGTYKKLPQRKQKQAGREDVARAVARLISKRKNSVTLTFVGRLQAFALRFFPFVVRMILKKADRDYDNMYDH